MSLAPPLTAIPMLGADRRGAGPPLVLLHPLGADRRMWAPVLDRLAAEREVIAVDLPGFGASPPLPDGAGPPTPAALARTVAAFLRDGLGLERPHVAGNSLGGWVALELALAGEARSVTAIAPAGLWAEPLAPKRGAARSVGRALGPVLGGLVRTAGGRRLALSGSIAHPERVPAADAAHLVRSYATAPGFRAVNDAMRAGTFTGLDDIEVPVTLCWPELDRVVSRASRVPARVSEVELPGCGHLPTWDAPELVARALLDGSAA